MERVFVIGGGLDGSEAAWQAAQHGVKVTLFEMRPLAMLPAHRTGDLAELSVATLKVQVDVQGTRAMSNVFQACLRVVKQTYIKKITKQ